MLVVVRYVIPPKTQEQFLRAMEPVLLISLVDNGATSCESYRDGADSFGVPSVRVLSHLGRSTYANTQQTDRDPDREHARSRHILSPSRVRYRSRHTFPYSSHGRRKAHDDQTLHPGNTGLGHWAWRHADVRRRMSAATALSGRSTPPSTRARLDRDRGRPITWGRTPSVTTRPDTTRNSSPKRSAHGTSADEFSGDQGRSSSYGHGTWLLDGRPEYIKKAARASARRLGVDSIGLYQYHRPDPEMPYEDTIGALVELLDDGVIRMTGISNANSPRFFSLTRSWAAVRRQYKTSSRHRCVLVCLSSSCAPSSTSPSCRGVRSAGSPGPATWETGMPHSRTSQWCAA